MADSDTGHPPYRWSGKDLILSVVVQPRASNNALVGIQGAHIKVRLTASPVDGKANQLLIKLLAQWFHVPVSRVSIEHGDTSKRKIVRIQQPENLPEFIEIP